MLPNKDKVLIRLFPLGVVGFSKRPNKLVIYTSKELNKKERKTVLSIIVTETDYSEKEIEIRNIGTPRALGFFPEPVEPARVEGKTDFNRPLVAGISIGHRDITAGTLGGFVRVEDELYLFSNAHVLTPNPFLYPYQIKEKRILQPGPYDLQYDESKYDKALVGYYEWHVKLDDIWEEPPRCPISKTLYYLYRLLRRKSKLVTFANKNYIDFAIAKIKKDVKVRNKTYHGLPKENMKFVGLIFAGSEYVGVSCKVVKYLGTEKDGWGWLWETVEDVNLFDDLAKDGRTTCLTISTKEKPFRVIDPSCCLTVYYGDGHVAWFEDVFLTDNVNGQQVRGGDSGSPVFVIE